MKIKLSGKFRYNSDYIMKKCSYGKILNRRNREVSYVRRLGTGLFPRFHVYVDDTKENLVINLHLDQKRTSYRGSHAHSGEYDSDLVLEEGERIKRWFESMKV